MQNLEQFLTTDGPERCGVILDTGEVLEIPNVHPDPSDAFAMPVEVLTASNVVATWHTHPRSGPNLSVADYFAFTSQPRLRHYIVSASGTWSFGMVSGILARL